MLKRFLSLLIICFCLVPFSACGEDFYPMKTEESFEFYPIETSTENITNFVTDIEKFVSTYEEGLILGSIQLIIDQNFDYKVNFEFSKSLSETIASRVSLTYDPIKEGIEYSRHFTGHRKVYSPFDKALNYSHWKINFQQAQQILKDKMTEKDIQIFDRIVCNCYENVWQNKIFLKEDSEYVDAIEITIEP